MPDFFYLRKVLWLQAEPQRWSSTPFFWVWTGMDSSGKKLSLFLSWRQKTTLATLTVSLFVVEAADCQKKSINVQCYDYYRKWGIFLDIWTLISVFFPVFFLLSARSDRYHHLASDEDEETNDEESSLEIRQFSSWSHRFSKVNTNF